MPRYLFTAKNVDTAFITTPANAKARQRSRKRFMKNLIV